MASYDYYDPDEYWENRRRGPSGGKGPEGQGSESSGTWGNQDIKAWTPDPTAYQPGQQFYESQNYINRSAYNALRDFDPNAQNVDQARQAGMGSRDYLMALMNEQRNRPLDSTALGAAMMRQGQQQVAGNMASQLASQRFSPAALRQAQQGIAGAGQNVALAAQQQAMQSAIQERAAREANLGKMALGMTEQDINRMRAETALRGGDQSFWAQQQAALRNWGTGMLGTGAYEQAQRQAYERAKMEGFFGKQGPVDPTTGQIIGGTMQAAAAAIGASDVRAKKDIESGAAGAQQFLTQISDYENPTATAEYIQSSGPMSRDDAELEDQAVQSALGTGGAGASEKKGGWRAALSAALSAFGKGMGSDRETKERIGAAGVEAGALLEALRREGPKAYQYKSGYGPEGQQFGPMAQTLEKAGPMGQAMVGVDPASGMRYLKGPETMKGLLAAVAQQQREIEALKERGPGRGEPKMGSAAWFRNLIDDMREGRQIWRPSYAHMKPQLRDELLDVEAEGDARRFMHGDRVLRKLNYPNSISSIVGDLQQPPGARRLAGKEAIPLSRIGEVTRGSGSDPWQSWSPEDVAAAKRAAIMSAENPTPGKER